MTIGCSDVMDKNENTISQLNSRLMYRMAWSCFREMFHELSLSQLGVKQSLVLEWPGRSLLPIQYIKRPDHTSFSFAALNEQTISPHRSPLLSSSSSPPLLSHAYFTGGQILIIAGNSNGE